MSSTLDEGSDVAIAKTGNWPDGVEFKFPRRRLGWGQWLLFVLILASLALFGGMIAGSIDRIVQKGFGLASVLMLAFWSFVAFPLCRYPLWYGLALLVGHTEIELRARTLFAGNRVGWLRRGQQWPLYRLNRIQVFDVLPEATSANQLRAAMSVAPDNSKSAIARHLHLLTAVLDNGQRVVLALAYPKPLLESVAQELSEQIAHARKQLSEEANAGVTRRAPPHPELALAAQRAFGPPPTEEAGAIETGPAIGIPELIAEAKEARRKRAEPDVFDQPPESRAQVDWFDDGGITFRIPPAGVWKGSAGAFPFGVLFAAVTAGFTLLFAGAGIAQGQGVWGALGIMSLFWIASAALLVVGYVMGTRESAVAVVGDKVMVMQTGLRQAKRREWPRSEVKTARVGPSGTEVNDKPIPELQLHGAQGKLFGMLAGHDVRELQWIATLIRQALKSAEPGSSDQSSLQSVPEEIEPLGGPDAVSPFNFAGMTIQERLQVARLSDEFAGAMERGDRETMLELLARVQLPPAGAAAFVDTILSHAQQREA
jgi:hypothetical protein